MAMYKKNTRRKVVKGKKMKRSIATRRKHKKSNGRRTRRGGLKNDKKKPPPILLPTAEQRVHRAANPTTAMREDRILPGDWLRQDRPGQPPSPSAENRGERNQIVVERLEAGLQQANAREEERNQLPPSP